MPREIVGMIGPNGAGKTTIFDLISGFVSVDAGRIELEGRDITDLGPSGRAGAGLGRSFQDAKLFPDMTVHETLAVSLERWVKSRSALAAALRLPAVFDDEERTALRVSELIELMNLGDYRNAFVRELSTGTRRVVDLACIAAHRPVMVLLDEPSSGIAQREVEALAPVLRGCATRWAPACSSSSTTFRSSHPSVIAWSRSTRERYSPKGGRLTCWLTPT
jgi:ABC-type branched-subunit amino acid transport system ATPase component